MSDEYEDPSGSTMAFRAYMERKDGRGKDAAPARSRLPLIIGGVVAALVVLVLVLWLALG